MILLPLTIILGFILYLQICSDHKYMSHCGNMNYSGSVNVIVLKGPAANAMDTAAWRLIVQPCDEGD